VLRAIIPLSIVSNSSVLPNTSIVAFQVLSIKRPWQRGSLYTLNHIRIFRNYFLNSIRSFPIWWPFPKVVTFRPNRQNCFPNEISDLKSFFLDFLIVGSSYSQFIPLDLTLTFILSSDALSNLSSIKLWWSTSSNSFCQAIRKMSRFTSTSKMVSCS
jgi:hypothetical protein